MHAIPSSHSSLASPSRGRKLAVLVLIIFSLVELLAILPSALKPDFLSPVSKIAQQLRQPVTSARSALFEGYQQLFPRQRQSQPLTIVAIDEKSIHQLGQWPWPRNQLANLITAINAHQPAAIGLDFYMPEADQHSVEKLTKLLPSGQQALKDQLLSLPGNDFQLAMALSRSPSVLGAAGFTVKAYTTSNHLESRPVEIIGQSPLEHINNFPQVLSNLKILEQSAAGIALLSIPAHLGGISRFPLLSAVNGQPIPSMPLELLRVATSADAVSVFSTPLGIQSMQVGDIKTPTQWNGEVWPYYTSIETSKDRYLSAVDVLRGNFDPSMLNQKLILIGLTGTGLSDMRFTLLNEQVPGIEIQAQVIEGLFDNTLLIRPDWLPFLELALVIVAGSLLIWRASWVQAHIKKSISYYPIKFTLVLIALSVLLMTAGLTLFVQFRVLFSSISVLIGVLLVSGVFFLDAVLLNLRGTQVKLAQLIDCGITFAKQKSQQQLLNAVHQSLTELAPHQSCLILLRSDKGEITPASHRGVSRAYTTGFEATSLLEQHLPSSLLQGKTKQLDAQDLAKLSRELVQLLEQIGNQSLNSLLLSPMLASDESFKGVLILINPTTPEGKPLRRFSPNTIKLVNSLVTQATVALENQQLVKAQQNMMDATVQILAGAIDEKSPYTGAHCERVPVLAEMLCKAACESQQGALQSFTLHSEDEWREFKMASWLHDCGKITTPEYVVDKATKLETIYNRIHEVRTRFEVLLRDADIARLKAIYEQGINRQQADNQFNIRKKQLLDDFAFIAKSNVGGEFLSQEDRQEIHRIGRQTWQRHFDNRLGLSAIELQRYPQDSASEFPVIEALLDDRPEHKVARPETKSLDPNYGFKMEVPELLFNHGELHNLAVSRGTLSEEERFTINEHIIQTIVILDQIPFPANLQRVSEIAGAHHETLIGTGYPRKLTEKELSVPAKILAIADIFEALTASDRPYKRAKTLSEAIHILSFFKRDRHIDGQLFDLFLTQGIYQKYAEQFLSAEQIDEVDIDRYLN